MNALKIIKQECVVICCRFARLWFVVCGRCQKVEEEEEEERRAWRGYANVRLDDVGWKITANQVVVMKPILPQTLTHLIIVVAASPLPTTILFRPRI